jgi:programmed cell death protein 4
MRSKSECHHRNTVENEKDGELMGVVVKTDKFHDKKPKNTKGNGKPKKAGGGGKGTWGKNGVVYEDENADPADPNYDIMRDAADEVRLQEVIPDLTSVEFDKVVTPMFLEYYNHGMTGEVVASLKELNIEHLKHRVVYLAVVLAMEKHGAQRELTSTLLSALYGDHVVQEQDFELGFQALMNALSDLKLDTPDAADILGKFMARSVADDCLRPCYIKEHLEHPSNVARVALERANCLLQMKHGIVRLDSIWGFGGGIRPVKLLVKEIVLMIKEYLSSNDLKEAERCVVDLDVPHFHHEIVYEALVIALEDGSEKTINDVIRLLKHLHGDTMITESQMNAGFERVYSSMDDIVLDSPRAFKFLDTMLEMCCRASIVPLWLRQKAPSRGRKRYVSEGDFSVSNKSFAFAKNGENGIAENGHDEPMEE